MKTTWRLLEDSASDAGWNMAVDEALLTLYPEIKQPTLRLYRWATPTLSLGYFQDLGDVDLDECQANGIGVVRRPTGGRAVLHDHEWTYSVVAGLDLLPGGVSASYRALSDALIAAMHHLGLAPELQRHQTKSDSAVCFDTPAFAELTLDNKKVSGSAQTRTKHALLQHGSIPVEFPWSALAVALRLSEAQVRLLKRQAAGLAEFGPVTLEKLHDALITGFESQFGPLALDVLSSEEKKLAQHLVETKYKKLDWRSKEAPHVAGG